MTEGILAFLAERADFEALILGFNKLVLVPAGARGLYEPLVTDSAIWWQLFRQPGVGAQGRSPSPGRPTHIVIVPGWRTHPELNRVVALVETFRHGLAYRVRERVAALTGRVNAR